MTNLFCYTLNTVITIYVWLIIIAILLTYVQPNRNNQMVQLIWQLTNPAFDLARKYLPFLVISGIDLSPIAIIFALNAIPVFICSYL